MRTNPETVSDILSEISTKQSAEPPELPRLTVGATFNTYARLVIALQSALEAAQKVPEQPNPDGCLTDIIRHCQGAIRHSERLKEGNR